MRDYELMVVMHPDLDAAGITGMLDALKARIGEFGEVTACDFLGRRKLAYSLRKVTQGSYALINFTAPAERLRDFRQWMLVQQREQIIRHLLVRDEKTGTRPPAQPLPGEDGAEPEETEEERLARAADERARLEAEAAARAAEAEAEQAETAPATTDEAEPAAEPEAAVEAEAEAESEEAVEPEAEPEPAEAEPEGEPAADDAVETAEEDSERDEA